MRRINTNINNCPINKSSNYSSMNNLQKSHSKVRLEDLSSVLTSSDQGAEDSESKRTLKNDFVNVDQSRPGT